MKLAVALLASVAAFATQAQTAPAFANATDKTVAGKYEAREKDWRNGAVVYQVLVDRFAPSANLEAKKALYPPPKVLRAWSELPKAGSYVESAKVWSHEIDFWGGDLASLMGKLDYVQQLGADVLYLNPVHLAYTNHKYDALDYLKISPEFGSREDVKRLAADTHQRGMKLVFDGVFNHMGRNSPYFQSAQKDPKSPYRDWFVFGSQFPSGVRAWANAENLPELNLENPRVRDYIYRGKDSVVRSYLRDGIDGWRLDVAFDIGFVFLDELTRAAHAEKAGSLVVGEIANYPQEWYPSVDGVLHFTLRQIILDTVNGKIDAATATKMFERMIRDAGTDNMLKSWVYLDNHDTERLATTVPNEAARRLALVLQFTLPGSPNLYYGTELDMPGGGDPEMRAPMRWDLVAANPPALQWTRQLIKIHKDNRALRIGDFRLVTASKLIAFERYTDRARDTVIVILNPGDQEVQETVMLANSKLMDGSRMVDLLGRNPPMSLSSSLLRVKVPAKGILLLKPDVTPVTGYTNYKRVQ